MSAYLPGNPYAESLENYDDPRNSIEAVATLALAYEQRTANLIAFYGYGDIVDLDTITESLGL